jgi:hypothetical protein
MTTRLHCAASLLLMCCTDGATRVAYDIEAGVDVPRTLIMHKGRGQHVWLDLAKDGDRIVVTGLR